VRISHRDPVAFSCAPRSDAPVVLKALARLVVKRSVAWVIVALTLLLTILSSAGAARVGRDDDLLAFLPAANPDIKAFNEVNKRFGSLDVALVGIANDDPFSQDFLTRLQALTKKLDTTGGVQGVMSLSNVEDFAADLQKGGIRIDYLAGTVPKTPAESAALREKVMSRDQVVGNLVSADGKAALVYCFVAYGADPKVVAADIRRVVEDAFPKEAKYWGGAPFIQSYIFGVTEKDLRRLAPWACVVIVLLSIWSFRDAIGTVLALFSTGVGITSALGLMYALGEKTNLVVGSMPVILFALGSAYPIHLLTRYYTVAGHMGRDKAVEHSITYLGPTVIASALTTMGGLFSLVAMDVQPIRSFGFFTAIGVLVTLVLTFTFVPAVIVLADLKGNLALATPTSQTMVRFCTAAATKRGAFGVVLGLFALGGALFLGRLDSRVDNASFYSASSPPAKAEAFLREHFGGSQFLQIHVEGDMEDPDVLREVRALADRVALVPHVTSVSHLGVVMGKINEAMDGDERIPDTGARVKLLYGFLTGKQAVRQFVTDDRKHTLVIVKLDTDRAADLDVVLAEVERLAAEVPKRVAAVEVAGPRGAEAQQKLASLAEARVLAAAAQYKVSVSPAALEGVRRAIATPVAADPSGVKAAIVAYLGSDEFAGDLPKSPADAADRVATALATVGSSPSRADVAAAIAKAIDRPASDEVVGDLAATLHSTVIAIARRQSAIAGAKKLVEGAGLAAPAGPKGQRFTTLVASALIDLGAPTAALEPAGGAEARALSVHVTGTPVLNRGLSRSTDQNQLRSFFLAMSLVLAVTLWLYRSLSSALLAMAPVTLTLLVVYGGMGLLGVHLDIGTSMLASLTTGAGVDYAIHLLAAWKAEKTGTLGDAAAYSAFLVGRAIWTNALVVAAGFVVLTMGEARPLQNVGGLTATAMIVAALATFAAIPVFARKLAYDHRPRIEGVVVPSDHGAAPVGPSGLEDEPLTPSVGGR
jgi:predicted RND superfamily exporter protein